ncbi:MAG TPA: Phenylacetic acid catabolic protein [Gemmatimonadales bacterium]|nr:Phenylacetic acid catabolic protein [Gemmatimonadales bacterium]
MTASATLEYPTGAELPPGCEAALRHLLVACADTKLMLGYHYGEWTFGTPVLEAAIANCSLAQTELGHVRLLHGILKAHLGEDPDALVERRAAGEFANVNYLDRDLTDWAAVVAATYVVDVTISRVVASMAGSSFLPVRGVTDKMLEEERYHAHHGRGWFRALAARGGDSRGALETAVRQALRSVAEWLGPADDPEDRALVAAGVKARPNRDLLADLAHDLAETGAAAGIAGLGDLTRLPPPDGAWSPVTRRGGGGGPLEEILYHMRGSKNAVFRQE